MLDRYLIPLAPFVLIGINGVLCLFFFLCLEHEMRVTNLRWRRRHTAQESATVELKAEVAELGARMQDTEERSGILVPPVAPKSGLNLNKRTQAIRMSRRGEQAEMIAAALSLPRREVELLLKVHGRMIYGAGDLTSKNAADSKPVNSGAVNS
jgi:hypothetical protein